MVSLWPFYRRQDGEGGRVPNLVLEAEPPSLLALRALTYYEQEQGACYWEQPRSEREERSNDGT